MSIVVKRKGHMERFDEKKVYGSIFAACVSAHYSKAHCKEVAEEITGKIKKFIKNKKDIKTAELHKKIMDELKKINKELSFFYEHHIPNLKKL